MHDDSDVDMEKTNVQRMSSTATSSLLGGVEPTADDTEEELCTICQDPLLDDLCSLPECVHLFHFNCLKRFYEIKRSNWHCPLCRRPFTKVKVIGIGWVDAIVREEEPSESEVEEEEDDEACLVCGGYGEVIICDGCDEHYHPHCAGLSNIPEDDWYCSSCRARRSSAGRRPQSRAVAPSISVEEQKLREERTIIENAWRHFEMVGGSEHTILRHKDNSTGAPKHQGNTGLPGAQIDSSSLRNPEDPKTVASLLRALESTTKSEIRRRGFLSKIVGALQSNKSDSFRVDLIRQGFLMHLRGWFQLSLDSPEKDSFEERHFRFVLLQQIDGLKGYISKENLKSSRLNKAMLRCVSEDNGENRKLATQLFDHFCNSLADVPTRMASPVQSVAQVPILKRAKVRKL